MSLIDVLLPKKYKNTKVLFEKNLDDWRLASQTGFQNANYNLQQIGLDVFGASYVYNNNGGQSQAKTVIQMIAEITSGAIPITGVSSVTFAINTGGFAAVLTAASLSAARGYTIPDRGGVIEVRSYFQTAASMNVGTEYSHIGVTDTSAVRTITILSSAITDTNRYAWTITDETGGANAKNITVVGQGGELINGQPSAVIVEPYGSITVYSNGTNLLIAN